MKIFERKIQALTALVTLVALFPLVVSGCGDDSVQTSELIVRSDLTVDFSQFQTFSVVTEEIVPEAPEADDDEAFFNDLVNDLIVDAMTREPVCMTFIPPNEVSEQNVPDLFAANGLARSTEEGVVWECVGGWWWGYYGYYWDSCAWLWPVPVSYDVGSLLVPVGPPVGGGEGTPVFAGLAQSIVGTGPDAQTKARTAVDAIFAQWPVQRTCPDAQ